MDYCHVEFEPKDPASLQRLSDFFSQVKETKEADTSEEKEPQFIAYFTDDERSYFWNPSPAELDEWNKDWSSTPSPARHSDETLWPRWTLESMLDAFWEGDYELLGILREGSRHFLAFNPSGYPYGGTGSFVALVECFGHRVLGVDDGTGYVPHVQPTKFWRSRESGGL